MKKLLSLALALTLCLSLTVPAFAEEEKTDETTPTVTGTEGETPAGGEDAKDPAEGEDAEAPDGEEKSPAEGEDSEAPGEDEEAEEPGDDTATAPVNPFTDVAETSPFYQAILWAVDQGITLGTTETTFGPGNTCSISNIITFLWRANGKPGAEEGVSDRDSAAKWGVEQRLIGENEDLSVPCTRVMAMAYMWRIAGNPESTTEISFTDIDKEADYAGAVAWAVENDVTTGTSETTFSPDNTCTRGQIVTFLYRAASAASVPAEKADSGAAE